MDAAPGSPQFGTLSLSDGMLGDPVAVEAFVSDEFTIVHGLGDSARAVTVKLTPLTRVRAMPPRRRDRRLGCGGGPRPRRRRSTTNSSSSRGDPDLGDESHRHRPPSKRRVA